MPPATEVRPDPVRELACQGCGSRFPYKGRGRPPKWCEPCAAEKQRAYYEANRDEIAEKQRAYREANRDEIAEKKRAYREANRDEIAEKQRAYREANRDEIAEKQRAYYEANRDEIAEKQRLAREGRLCSLCEGILGEGAEDGVCGTCLLEMAAEEPIAA